MSITKERKVNMALHFQRCDLTGQYHADGELGTYWINDSMPFDVLFAGTGIEKVIGTFKTQQGAIDFANWHNKLKLRVE